MAQGFRAQCQQRDCDRAGVLNLQRAAPRAKIIDRPAVDLARQFDISPLVVEPSHNGPTIGDRQRVELIRDRVLTYLRGIREHWPGARPDFEGLVANGRDIRRQDPESALTGRRP